MCHTGLSYPLTHSIEPIPDLYCIYMDRNKGTPKSLHEAIKNAMGQMYPEIKVTTGDARQLASHVQDFLAQKFGYAMLKDGGKNSEPIKELWEKIFL